MAALGTLLLAVTLVGANNDTVLLEFTADWCPHCERMEPTIQRLVRAGFPIQQIDIDKQREARARYNIKAIPSFVLMHQGKEIARLEETASFDRLVQLMAQAGLKAQAGEIQVRGQSPEKAASGLLGAALRSLSGGSLRDGL